MSTTVRIQATVEIEVGTWGDKGMVHDLSAQSVREGAMILRSLVQGRGQVVSVDKVLFVTHGLDINGDKVR